jgi:regulator of sirC expression with transglutaminase-like and TPR domain
MTSADDLQSQAQAHLAEGNYDKAIAVCTEAIRLDSNAVWAYLCRGVARDFQAGRFWFGDDLPATVSRQDPTPASQGGRHLAIADFTEAIRLDPTNAAAHGNRGNAYLAAGQNSRAVADYTEAIRLDPANPGRYVARARANQALDWDRAVADFEEAIRRDPKEPNHHVSRVNAFGIKGLWNQIIAELTEAVRADPNDALAYALRATAHNGMNRFDRSIPDADEAIRLDPELFLGYSARGYGYLQRGNPQPGGRSPTGCSTFLIHVAVGAVPGFLVGYLITNWAGNPALGSNLPVILAVVGGLVSWFFLGFLPALARQKRDLRQSVADFTRALELRPNDPSAHMGRALAYRALGDTENAARDMLWMKTPADSPRPGG